MELGIIVEVFSIGFAFGSEPIRFIARCFCCHFSPLAFLGPSDFYIFGARHLFWMAGGVSPPFLQPSHHPFQTFYRPQYILFTMMPPNTNTEELELAKVRNLEIQKPVEKEHLRTCSDES